MRAIYLNLDHVDNRRAWMEAQSAALGVNLERFAAVNGQDLDPDVDRSAGVSDGAVACFLSHRAVWADIAAADDPHVAVFEDDVLFSPDAPAFINDDGWIPEDADIVHLERERKLVSVYGRPSAHAHGRQLYRLHGECAGTAAYVISRRCAEFLCENFTEIDQEFDQILFDGRFVDELTIYKMTPAMCIQDQYLENPRFEKSIEREPYPMTVDVKRNKFFREVDRLFRQLRSETILRLGRRRPTTIRVKYR